MSLTIACVWTGTKYERGYVERLRNMVQCYLKLPHRFICLTDRPDELDGVDRIDIAGLALPGWWAKMALFNPDIRGAGYAAYLDLDTVAVGDLAPLARVDAEFAICANFTRLAGHLNWPCRYGSCAMTFREGWGSGVWERFWRDRRQIMAKCPRGDQEAIELLVPDAVLLQDVLPSGYFLGYRDLTPSAPTETAVVVFGGQHKPDNCPIEWVKRAWHATETDGARA